MAGIIAGVLAAMSLATPTAAQQSHWMFGEWCSDNEIMYASSAGVGFNEHTTCGWTEAPAASSPAKLTLACRNVYFDGDLQIEAFHEMMKLEVKQTSANELSLRFRDDDDAVSFKKCVE